MTKTVLITGGTGLLGRQVVKAFQHRNWRVTGTGFSRAKPPNTIKLDLTSETEIAKVIEDVNPDVVVHCAANRFPDSCEQNPSAARALNITSTTHVATQCASHSILLIYISTDYVFSGRPGEAPYEVDASPSPSNLYGETKWEGERAVLREYEKAGKVGWGVVVRVPVLYGSVEQGLGKGNGESAVNVLMDVLMEAQEKGLGRMEEERWTKVDDWALRYPTNTEDVARIIQDIATKNLSSSPSTRTTLPQILHFSSEDRYTKYQICQVLAEIMGLPMDGLKPVSKTPDLKPTETQRPYDCHLSTRALKELGVDTSTVDFADWWRREVRAFRK